MYQAIASRLYGSGSTSFAIGIVYFLVFSSLSYSSSDATLVVQDLSQTIYLFLIGVYWNKNSPFGDINRETILDQCVGYRLRKTIAAWFHRS